MELLEQMIAFVANGGNYGQKPMKQEPEVIINGKFDTDIEALDVFYSLEPGSEIVIQLQDLLAICPRTRRRNDAYRGLIAELGRRGVILTIKNKKVK